MRESILDRLKRNVERPKRTSKASDRLLALLDTSARSSRYSRANKEKKPPMLEALFAKRSRVPTRPTRVFSEGSILDLLQKSKTQRLARHERRSVPSIEAKEEVKKREETTNAPAKPSAIVSQAAEKKTETLLKKKDSLSAKLGAFQVENVPDNTCGQYAVCAVLQSVGVEVDYQSLCREMNPDGLPTRARPIEEYLDPYVAAERNNAASVQELKAQIDVGRSAMLSVCYREGEPHWIVVKDYETNAGGDIVSWNIIDSNWARKSDTGIGKLSHQDLMQRWAKPFGKKTPSEKDSKYTNYWIKLG